MRVKLFLLNLTASEAIGASFVKARLRSVLERLEKMADDRKCQYERGARIKRVEFREHEP